MRVANFACREVDRRGNDVIECRASDREYFPQVADHFLHLFLDRRADQRTSPEVLRHLSRDVEKVTGAHRRAVGTGRKWNIGGKEHGGPRAISHERAAGVEWE